MKKTILLSGILFISAFSNAQTSTSQNSTVEKSVTGAQIGLFGLDIYNEAKLADKIVLRSETSLFPAIWGGDMYAKTGFAFYPALTIQPKYYYNIAKRAENGKNTNAECPGQSYRQTASRGCAEAARHSNGDRH